MKTIPLLSAGCLLGLASFAHAQCSSWNNLMEIMAVVGEEEPLIDAELSDQTQFVFWPSYDDSCVGFLVNDTGVTVFYNDWQEDAGGTAVMEDGEGRICTITCDGDGLAVLIEEGDQGNFIPEYFTITGAGSVAAAPPPAACSCAGSGTRSQIVCTKSACDNNLSCKYTGAFPGTPSGWCTYPPPPGGN